jgi:hypothetical protein
VGGAPLFDETRGDSISYRVAGNQATWTLNLELKRSEVQ